MTGSISKSLNFSISPARFICSVAISSGAVKDKKYALKTDADHVGIKNVPMN